MKSCKAMEMAGRFRTSAQKDSWWQQWLSGPLGVGVRGARHRLWPPQGPFANGVMVPGVHCGGGSVVADPELGTDRPEEAILKQRGSVIRDEVVTLSDQPWPGGPGRHILWSRR